MRKITILGVALICAVLISSGVQAQRIPSVEAAATARPTQVEVINFPAVQSVAGTVNVGNLPAVQMVEVVNPPAPVICPQPIHFVGFTTDSYMFGPEAVLEMNRACNLDFPNARACESTELYRAIPTPVFPMDGTSSLRAWVGLFYFEQGYVRTMNSIGQMGSSSTVPMSVACCGY